MKQVDKLKACSYCGRENKVEAITCHECGTDFPIEPTFPKEPRHIARDLIDLETIEDVFYFADGFTRVNWESVHKHIEGISREDWHEAWRQVGRQWVWKLRADLGGDYEVFESHHFLLLSEYADEAKSLISFCEDARDFLFKRLGDAAWRDAYGKNVLLLFSEEDDYYQYISHFYRDGTHAMSGGVCLNTGYVHLALPRRERDLKRVIAHELTHNELARLPIPAWLNEGLAMNFEDEIVGVFHHAFSPESIDELQTFWTDENIQMFWSGEGFDDVEAQQHSYLMARLLVRNLATDRKQFVEFIQHADYRDAGNTASVDCLGIDLGDAVAPFVSAECRRPNRKAIAAYFDRAAKAGEVDLSKGNERPASPPMGILSAPISE